MNTSFSTSFDFSTISAQVWIILGVVAVIQMIIMIVAIVRVAKAPDERVRKFPGLNEYSKVFWIVLALVGSTVGGLLSLFLGVIPKSHVQQSEPVQTPNAQLVGEEATTKETKHVIDMLYGEGTEEPKSQG